MDNNNKESHKDSSGDLEAVESECSTVPTDLTVSIVTESYQDNLSTRMINVDRKNWIQELHLLKLELSKKNLLLQNLKADFMSSMEELEEKLADALHHKEMMKIRFDSQIHIKEEEWKKKEKKLKAEVDLLNQKIMNIEQTVVKFREDCDYLSNHLNKSLFGDKQLYYELKQKVESLSFKEQILLQCYDFTFPYKIQKEELENKFEILQKQFQECKEELDQEKQERNKYHQEYTSSQEKYLQVVQELSNIKRHIQFGNYAQENFSRIKEERDKLHKENLDLREIANTLQVNNSALISERDDLKNEILHSRHQQALLQQEREHFGKQLAETTRQWGEAQDRISQLTLQLDRTKQTRENMFNQFITARDQFKIEYEEKLRHEMDQIRKNTNQEIEKLKTHTNLFYEKEMRSLQESRHSALKQKEELELSLKQAKEKCELLVAQLQQSQLREKNIKLELQSEIQQKKYEIDKLLEIHEDRSVILEEQKLENEKLSTKLQAVTSELQLVQQKQAFSENELQDKTIKLEKYKKLEKDLDEISFKASELIKDDNSVNPSIKSCAEKLMFPKSSLETLQHNVNLVHKIIELEKQISSLQQELIKEKENRETLANELSVTNNLLKFTKKPHSLVLNAIREKETQIHLKHQEISSLKQQLENLVEENEKLIKSHQDLSDEMERIINNREELGKVKQLLITLHHKQKESSTDAQRKIIKILPPDHASSRSAEEISSSSLHSFKDIKYKR